MEIPLDVDVRCGGEVCGKSTAIIVNPITNSVTHFVVQAKGFAHEEYLVPLEVITESTAHSIDLSWSQDELAHADPFVTTVFLGESGADPVGASTMYWPYAVPGEPYAVDPALAAYSEVEQIPHGELAVHRGAHVEATDGRVGTVDELMVNSENSHITHLILRTGHLWGKKDVTVPISAIDHTEDDVVYLNIDKHAVGELPSISVRKR